MTMRTQPLGLAAVGVAAVGLDPRVVAWDALPDAAGWVLVAVAAWQLSIRWTWILALVAGAAAVAEAQLPYHYDSIDPMTGEVMTNIPPGLSYHERLAFDPLSGARLVLLAMSLVAGGLALWVLLRELARRAAAADHAQDARRLGLLAWAVVLGWAAPPLVRILRGAISGEDGFDPVWNGGWELPAMAGIAAMCAVALLFATTANRHWSAAGDQAHSPWDELRHRREQAEGY